MNKTTFEMLTKGDRFRFVGRNPGSPRYVKLSATRYQLLTHEDQPYPGMTYDLSERGGRADLVSLA